MSNTLGDVGRRVLGAAIEGGKVELDKVKQRLAAQERRDQAFALLAQAAVSSGSFDEFASSEELREVWRWCRQHARVENPARSLPIVDEGSGSPVSGSGSD